jgi:hypothetical protein
VTFRAVSVWRASRVSVPGQAPGDASSTTTRVVPTSAEMPCSISAIHDGVRAEMTTNPDKTPTPLALSRRDPSGRFEASTRLPRFSRFARA